MPVTRTQTQCRVRQPFVLDALLASITLEDWLTYLSFPQMSRLRPHPYRRPAVDISMYLVSKSLESLFLF